MILLERAAEPDSENSSNDQGATSSSASDGASFNGDTKDG
jgi:hypothetical protein